MIRNLPIVKLLVHLHTRRSVQLALAFVLMIAGGVAEAVSLAAVVPFLWGLTNPGELWKWPFVQLIAPTIGVSGPSELLLPTALIFGAVVLIAGAIRLANVWLNSHLSAAVGSDFSEEAFRRSLYQSYSVHLKRNSSVLLASMTSQLDLTVLALNQFLQMISAVIVLVGLLLCLLFVDWQVALVAGAAASLIYGAVVVLAKSALLRNGELITRAQVEQVKVLRESLGAIRDLILNGTQRYFFGIYRNVVRPMRQRMAQNQFLSLYPRYAVEAIGMVAIVALAYGLISQRGNANEVVPLLGVFALAAQRLLPTIQLIYTGWTDLRAKAPAVSAVLDVLSQPLPPAAKDEPVRPMALDRQITFESVGFRYDPSGPQIVRELSFRIGKGERIGIVGTTGAGKSTTLDLLMGLLAPNSGRICIDDVDLHADANGELLPAWRAAIAHVPQSVYLSDSSFASNIAFGVQTSQIDMERVRRAAKQAQIADFIESSPSGYDGLVGERGVRLSGGQRQRIGIARALYREAPVLVFDEATNALDSTTEQAVVESIESLRGDLTIIVVAHRVSTLRTCDQIVELRGGTVSRIGSYEELIEQTA